MSDSCPSLTTRPSARGRLDRFGVILSGLCMVHCLAGLFLIGVLGIGGGILLDPAIHRIGLGLAVLVGFSTIGIGAVRHGRRLPLALGAAGLSLMASALVVEHGRGEALLTIAGVALVATAHILNLRRAPCC